MKFFCNTDVGLKREMNQDSYCSIKNSYNDYLFLVCDGIGGGKAGEVASGETVKFYINDFQKRDRFTSLDQAIEYLEESITNINKEIFTLANKYKEFQGMGTTLTGIMVTDEGVISINVGDSRVYGFADKKIFSLTRDHTLVNEMIDKGEITYEEALTHPKRHYLVKAIGVWNMVEPDIHKVKKLDQYLICSDGLHSYVSEEEILEIMNREDLDAENKVNELNKLALLKGGYDNITIIVVDFND